jgi:hypothetical protein
MDASFALYCPTVVIKDHTSPDFWTTGAASDGSVVTSLRFVYPPCAFDPESGDANNPMIPTGFGFGSSSDD